MRAKILRLYPSSLKMECFFTIKSHSSKSTQNEFGFVAERLKACSAAKRMFEVLS